MYHTMLILATGLAFIFRLADCDVLVKTQYGILAGTELENKVTGKTYFGFLNVPYAEKPIGDKRFKSPEEPKPWEGIRDAKKEGNECLSMNPVFGNIEGNEDCLNLNIYTHQAPSEVQMPLRSVMFWIHGGAFHIGSNSALVYGPDFLMMEDVILVTINYRLNVFGFLSTQNEEVPGNAGLKDQVMALKWVQGNIRFFGGDPQSITVFGESAGAASVHYLMLSPSAKGLFHRAILQSGTALSPWASTKYTIDAAVKLGKVFDCSEDNNIELVKCLRGIDAYDLAKHQYNTLSPILTEPANFTVFLPCIEPKGGKDAFLEEEPRKLLLEGKYNDVPFIIGTMEMETIFLRNAFSGLNLPKRVMNTLYSVLTENPELLLFLKLKDIPPKSRESVGQQMKKFYFKNLPVSSETIINMINMTSDLNFLIGAHDSIFYHLQQGQSKIFHYYFTLDTEYGQVKTLLQEPMKGPSHGDDVGYLFYINLNPQDISTNVGYTAMRKIVKLWTNFAKFGNPTPNKDLGLIWKPVTPDEQYYLEIGPELALKENLQIERLNFWRNLRRKENLTTF